MGDTTAAAAGAGLNLSATQQGNIDQMNKTMEQSQNFMMAIQEIGQKNSAMTTAIKTLGDEAQDSVKQRPQV